MSYTINKTDGSSLVVVNDGTINTSATSITLLGKNYAGYGEALNENMVKMLEHFSNNTAPSNALSGQIWYDSVNKSLNLYTGSGSWKSVGSLSSTNIAPSSPAAGELWFDTTNEQLMIWNGLSWLLVGPIGSATSGVSGLVSTTVTSGVTDFTVLQEFVGDKLIAIISPDLIDPLDTVVTGYGLDSIRPGYNFVADGGDVDSGVGVYNAKVVELGEESQFTLSTTAPATPGSTSIITTTGDLSLRLTGNIGVGTTAFTNSAKFTVSLNTANPQAPAANTVGHFVNVNGSLTRVLADSYAAIPEVSFRRANGTAASPTAMLTGESVGQLTWVGYGTNAYSTSRASIAAFTSEGWTNTAQGTNLRFYTTPSTTSTAAEVVRITDAGNVGIGTSTPASKLDVSGVLTVALGAVGAPSYTFTGDANTGMWAPAADTIAFSVGGTERVRVSSAGAITFSALSTNGFVKTSGGTGALSISAAVSLSADVTGTLPIANGGTGQTSASTALNALLPSQTGNNGKYLTTDGSGVVTWATVVGGGSTTVTDDTSTSATYYPLWTTVTSGTANLKVSSTRMTFNPGLGNLTLSGQFFAASGTAGAPAYSFNGDAITGVWRPAANTVAVSTNGVERMRINSAGKVGIGMTPTTYALEVSGDVQATTFRGVATSAQYADLAERYEADNVYTEGTLMKIGGTKEVTVVADELSDEVWGVISPKPAYLMNAEAGNDETHPALAQVGRIFVRLIGPVSKGDRIVSAGNGVARASKAEEATQFNVIGRSLETDWQQHERLVKVAVK